MSEVLEPAIENVTFDAVLNALADPVRLAFVRALDAVGDWTCGSDVIRSTGATIGRSTLSHHLKVLRDAGLVHTRVSGTRRMVIVRYEELERRFPGLLGMIRDSRAADPEGDRTSLGPPKALRQSSSEA